MNTILRAIAVTGAVMMALLGLSSSGPAMADAGAAVRLKWDDLMPRDGVPADPAAALSEDDRFDFENYIWLQGLDEKELAKEENKQTLWDVKKFLKRLEKSGRTIDQLTAAQAAYEKELAIFGARLVPDHAGKRVTITGYLLPLAFDPAGVTQFLLVPYVGACIHVPPPPANQMVLVTAKAPFRVKETFAPAVVIGTLAAEPTRQSLTLVDGSDDVAVGYTIKGAELRAIDP